MFNNIPPKNKTESIASLRQVGDAGSKLLFSINHLKSVPVSSLATFLMCEVDLFLQGEQTY